MVFVFDENIPQNIVFALSKLDEVVLAEHKIHSVYDLGFNGLKDVDLFPRIKETFAGEKCAFISGDKMILKRKPEIEELKRSGLIGFICAPSSCTKPLFERSLYVLNAWKSIIELAEKARSRLVYKIPADSPRITPSTFQLQ